MSLLRLPLTRRCNINRHTLLLVATGRLDDYRLTCEGLLDLAEVEPDPMTARDVLLSLRLAPLAVPDRTRAVQLAEKNFGGAAKDFIYAPRPGAELSPCRPVRRRDRPVESSRENLRGRPEVAAVR